MGSLSARCRGSASRGSVTFADLSAKEEGEMVQDNVGSPGCAASCSWPTTRLRPMTTTRPARYRYRIGFLSKRYGARPTLGPTLLGPRDFQNTARGRCSATRPRPMKGEASDTDRKHSSIKHGKHSLSKSKLEKGG